MRLKRPRSRLKGEDRSTLTRFCAERGLPKEIMTDNGCEFISKAMDKWTYERRVELDFANQESRPTTRVRRASTGGCARSA